MTSDYSIPDRRLPFAAVLADCMACVLVFPLAAAMIGPALPQLDGIETALARLPLGLLVISVVVFLLNPPEPPVWNVSRAIVAGVWRATLLFIALLWTMVMTGLATAVPVSLFVLAWGLLVLASAVIRAMRLVLARRIAL